MRRALVIAVRHRWLATMSLLGASLFPAAMAVPPGEVTNLQFCPASKTCLSWSALGPVQYRINRGTESTLPGLLNASTDSCLVRIVTGATTTGSVITDAPAAGSLHWYLVTAKNCEGEGTSGMATSGPRTLNSSGDCTAATCIDVVQNGNETGVDCGGGTCPGCVTGSSCCAGVDCQSGLCQAGVCQLRPNGNTCTASSQCVSGNCVDGVCCNNSCSGTCRACNVAGSIGTCVNVPTGQDPANECAGSAFCNGAGACVSPNGSGCTIGANCQSGNCVDNVCCNSACSMTCQACNVAGSIGTCANVPNGQDPANECAGAAVCNGAGACVSPNGSACTIGANCQSMNCVDNVCCNSACSMTCQACNVAGSIGTCANVPAGQDPANECAGPATCNGSGACGP